MRSTHARLCVALIVVVSLFAGGCIAVAAPNPPAITSLEARQELVAPLDSCLIECTAEDEDGDDLTYTWSADSGTINGHAGTVAWTAPDTEGLFKVTVEVSDGTDLPPVSATVTIRVKDNHYPVINSVSAAKAWVKPGTPCDISCDAEDIDGDSLSYSWEAGCGTVEASGSEVVWTAPEFEGDCTIRATVSDGYGGERTASTQVRVARLEPLVVTDMVVTAVDEPRYLRHYDESFKILKGKTCIIKCVVNNPERITSYEWSDGGPVTVFPVGGERFTFDSSPGEITWTAPMERAEYNITVVARDDDGHSASKSIVMKVETCTCAFPSDKSEEDAG